MRLPRLGRSNFHPLELTWMAHSHPTRIAGDQSIDGPLMLKVLPAMTCDNRGFFIDLKRGRAS